MTDPSLLLPSSPSDANTWQSSSWCRGWSQRGRWGMEGSEWSYAMWQAWTTKSFVEEGENTFPHKHYTKSFVYLLLNKTIQTCAVQLLCRLLTHKHTNTLADSHIFNRELTAPGVAAVSHRAERIGLAWTCGTQKSAGWLAGWTDLFREAMSRKPAMYSHFGAEVSRVHAAFCSHW